MQTYVQILVYIIIGAALLWFGYILIVNQWDKIRRSINKNKRKIPPAPADSRGEFGGKQLRLIKQTSSHSVGDPMVCPVCSTKLNKDEDELVQTLAFPSLTGGKDRLMHIRGCIYCIEGRFKRKCPVCKKSLDKDDILVARMFDRKNRRSHVHVLGCNKCRRTGKI